MTRPGNRSPQRSIAKIVFSLTVVLLLVILFVGREPLKRLVVETWYIHQLSIDQQEKQIRAAVKLGEMRSIRAVPRLLLSAARCVEDSGRVAEISWISWEALRDIVVHHDASIAYQFSRGLASERKSVRLASAEFLGGIRRMPRAVVPALVRVLRDADPALRATAVLALGTVTAPDADVLSSMTRVLTDGDPDVRRQAARAFGKIGAAASPEFPALLHLLKDADAGVRRQAVSSLTTIYFDTGRSDPAALSTLRQTVGTSLPGLMSDASSAVRASSLHFLSTLGTEAADLVPAPGLAVALGDPTPEVRANAALAAAELGTQDERVVHSLFALLKDPSSVVQRQAARALGRIVPRRQSPGKSAIQLLTDALEHNHDQVRFHAAGALGEIGPEASAAIEALARALQDPHESVRHAAAIALDRMGTGVKVVRSSIINAFLQGNTSLPCRLAEVLRKLPGTAGLDRIHEFLTAALRGRRPSRIRSRTITKATSRISSRDAVFVAGHLGRLAEPLLPDIEMLAAGPKSSLRTTARDALKRIRHALGPDEPGRPADVQLEAIDLERGFSASVFYGGIYNPDGIAVRDDGSLLVVNEGPPRGVFVARRGDTFDAGHAFSTTGPPFTSPDGILLHPDGSVFVTDIQLSAVLRIPPEGGAPIIFRAGGALGGSHGFSPNGIVLAPPTYRGPAVAPGDLVVADIAYSRSRRDSGALWAMHPSNGDFRVIARGAMFVDNPPLHLAMNPNGRLFVYGNEYRTVGVNRIVDVSCRGRVSPLVVNISGRGSMAVHPMTGMIYFTRQEETREVWRAPREGGEPKLFASGFDSRMQGMVFSPDGRSLFVSAKPRIIEITGPF